MGCAEQGFGEWSHVRSRKRSSNARLECVFAHACARKALSRITARASAVGRTVQAGDISDQAKIRQVLFFRGDVPSAQVSVLAGEKIVGEKRVTGENVAGRKAAAGGGDLCGRGASQR